MQHQHRVLPMCMPRSCGVLASHHLLVAEDTDSPSEQLQVAAFLTQTTPPVCKTAVPGVSTPLAPPEQATSLASGPRSWAIVTH
jgi:hypothetical protein